MYNNPYMYQPQMPVNQPQRNTDERIWVQNETAATAYLIAPNGFVRLWDASRPVFYEKYADASGKPEMEIYEYHKCQNMEAQPKEPVIQTVTKEEYLDFYRKVFMDYKEPLFWIHLNMDYPFNLKGILYFPKINTEYESIEGIIKLYNNQVFIADNIFQNF